MAMTTKPIKQVLDLVVLFQLEPHIWSGRSKLRKEDLANVPLHDLPPDTLASLGSKRKIDTEHLNVFDALKKRAERACKSVGVRFLGGYGVPVAKAPELAKELDQIEAEFQREKVSFLANYQRYVNEWVDAHPDWAHVLTSVITPVGCVDAATSFTWQAIQIREAKGRKADVLGRGLGKEVTGLSDRLFEEIASEATDMIEKSLHGRDRVTQKALNRVRALRDKLHDLAFLNATVEPLVQSMDYTLSLMPKAGHIEGIHYNALYGLMSLLSSPDRAKSHGQCINDGQTVEDAVSESVLGKDATIANLTALPATPGTNTVPEAEGSVSEDDAGVTPAVIAQPVSTPAPAPAMQRDEEVLESVCLF
jgi:hypothetical protein